MHEASMSSLTGNTDACRKIKIVQGRLKTVFKEYHWSYSAAFVRQTFIVILSDLWYKFWIHNTDLSI